MDPVLITLKGAVAHICLNRPDKFNSFNREMALLLQRILDQCAAYKNIRCIYLSGQGRAFCGGQDLGNSVGKIPRL